VIDVERRFRAGRKDCRTLLGELATFADIIDERLGRPPMVYASHAFWTKTFDCAGKPESQQALTSLAKGPLWVAAYDGEPKVFGSWTEWSFHQFSDDGSASKRPLDLDRFKGTSEDLLGWAKKNGPRP